MKRLLILTLTAAALLAQIPSPPAPPPNQYSFDDAFSSASSETLTLQLPANSNRGWYGFWLNISLSSSSATGKVCFLQNGTAATTTAGTVNQLYGARIPATKAFTASNSSGGVTVGCVTFTGAQSFNIGNMFMSRANSIAPAPAGTVQNISFVVTGTSISGDIFPIWQEY